MCKQCQEKLSAGLCAKSLCRLCCIAHDGACSRHNRMSPPASSLTTPSIGLYSNTDRRTQSKTRTYPSPRALRPRQSVTEALCTCRINEKRRTCPNQRCGVCCQGCRVHRARRFYNESRVCDKKKSSPRQTKAKLTTQKSMKRRKIVPSKDQQKGSAAPSTLNRKRPPKATEGRQPKKRVKRAGHGGSKQSKIKFDKHNSVWYCGAHGTGKLSRALKEAEDMD